MVFDHTPLTPAPPPLTLTMVVLLRFSFEIFFTFIIIQNGVQSRNKHRNICFNPVSKLQLFLSPYLSLHQGVSGQLVVQVKRIEVHFGTTFGSPERPPKRIFHLNQCKELHFAAEIFPTWTCPNSVSGLFKTNFFSIPNRKFSTLAKNSNLDLKFFQIISK